MKRGLKKITHEMLPFIPDQLEKSQNHLGREVLIEKEQQVEKETQKEKENENENENENELSGFNRILSTPPRHSLDAGISFRCSYI